MKGARRARRAAERARRKRDPFAGAPRLGDVAADALDGHHRNILRNAIRVIPAAAIEGASETSVLFVSLVGSEVAAAIVPMEELPHTFPHAFTVLAPYVGRLVGFARARGVSPEQTLLTLVIDEHHRASGFLLERETGRPVEINSPGGDA